jgi:choline dehydrogenase-like flavoprotein
MTSYRTLQPFQVANKEYDYIVVGGVSHSRHRVGHSHSRKLLLGGTAGCVVAARLSEDPNTSVLLIERGPIVDTWASHVPLLSADYRTPTSPVYSWTSQPVAALGRTLGLYSGKAMGGTSKVNAAIYTRSTPGEYNGWADKGRKGWGWNEVEKWFQKSEKTLIYDDKNRGHDGEAYSYRTHNKTEDSGQDLGRIKAFLTSFIRGPTREFDALFSHEVVLIVQDEESGTCTWDTRCQEGQ